MKGLFEQQAAARKHRAWHWCRLWNGFLDDPMLRVVADRLKMPLYQVQAFVTRLEILANTAEPRGYVGHFRPELLAVSLGMPSEDCARMFAELEHPDVGWIDQDHIALFYDRNRDGEDGTAAQRKRRQRMREAVAKKLGELARRGEMSEAERRATELGLRDVADDDLGRLNVRLANELAGFSTRHGMSRRDTVTVTPEKTTAFKVASNSAVEPAEAPQAVQRDSGESADNLTPQESAEIYLATDGLRLVVDRTEAIQPVAQMRISRWRKALDDDPVALLEVLRSLSETGIRGERFLKLVEDELARRKQLAQGPPLPLPAAVVHRRRINDG